METEIVKPKKEMLNKFGMMSELFDGCELLVAPGHLFDKLTRLAVRMKELEHLIQERDCADLVEQLQHTSSAYARTLLLADRIIEYYPDINEETLNTLYKQLQKINGDLMIITGCKTLRVQRKEVRNKINQLFDYPIEY